MGPIHPATMQAINNLILALERAQIGYRSAAENETNYELQSLLQHHSEERGVFLQELKNELKKQSGSGELRESSAQDRASDLTGTEFDDAETLAAYEQALEEDLPEDTREILEQQYDAIAEAHDHLLELRNLVTDTPTEGHSDSWDTAVAEKDDTEPRDITPDNA
jgi:hypothetical protein